MWKKSFLRMDTIMKHSVTLFHNYLIDFPLEFTACVVYRTKLIKPIICSADQITMSCMLNWCKILNRSDIRKC